MDVNNIEERIRIISASLGKKIEVGSKTKTEIRTDPLADKFEMRISFGSKSKEEILLDVMSIIQNLAALKDIVKKNLTMKGFDKQIMEDKKNSSLHLKLLIDLNNEYKHGYPLRDGYKSGHEPVISDLIQGIELPDGASVEISAFYEGRAELDKDYTIVIMGRINDRDGSNICTLDEMIEKSMEIYSLVISKYGLDN